MIRVADEGRVRVVTLDRPDARNALTPDALDAVETAVVEAPGSVVYLWGAGDAFCAGADLSVVGEIAASDRSVDERSAADQSVDEGSAAEAFVRQGQRVLTSIERADAVVVAGIDGAARGGGVELALACDLRIATPAASFAEPGVTFGLFGAWGGTVRLPEVVGLGEALDLSLSGRVLDAADAHRIGLVSRVVDDPREVADELAENDPSALRFVKERVRDRAAQREQEDREVAAFEALVAEHAATLAEHRKD